MISVHTLSKEPPARNNLTIIYSFVVALLPILATYASGIPGFSVADIVLVLFAGLSIFSKTKVRNRFSVKIGMLWCGLGGIILMNLLAFPEDVQILDMLIRTIRYFFYIFCVLYTSRKLLDVFLLKKYVKIISVIAALFMFLQWFLYNFNGYVLKGFIEGLELYTSDYAALDYGLLYMQNIYRPTSIFLEPAHFARYAAVGMTLFLWSDNTRLSDLLYAVMLTVGILISTSSQGYLLVALIWFLFAIHAQKSIRRPAVKRVIIIALLLSPIILLGALQLPAVKDTIERSLSGSIDEHTSAVGARLGAIRVLQDLSLYEWIFGNGFGVVPSGKWLSSALYWLYGSGLFVFTIYCLFMMSSLIKLKGYQKIVLLIFFMLFFTDDCFYSYMCVLFLSLSLLQSIHVDESKYEKNSIYSNGM